MNCVSVVHRMFGVVLVVAARMNPVEVGHRIVVVLRMIVAVGRTIDLVLRTIGVELHMFVVVR